MIVRMVTFFEIWKDAIFLNGMEIFLGTLFFKTYVTNTIPLIKINTPASGPVWYGSSSCWEIPSFSKSLIETVSEISAGNITDMRIIPDMVIEKSNTIHDTLEYCRGKWNLLLICLIYV